MHTRGRIVHAQPSSPLYFVMDVVCGPCWCHNAGSLPRAHRPCPYVPCAHSGLKWTTFTLKAIAFVKKTISFALTASSDHHHVHSSSELFLAHPSAVHQVRPQLSLSSISQAKQCCLTLYVVVICKSILRNCNVSERSTTFWFTTSLHLTAFPVAPKSKTYAQYVG